VQVVRSLLGFAVGSTLGNGGEVVAIVVTAAFVVVGSLLASMVCQPFLAAVTALLYTDARIRKEGFDLALVHAVTNPRAAG
jgi:type IV secretory pathway VirB3-like protein